MPRQARKQMKGRTQVNPQATFDFTVPRREVAAREVSMDVAAGGSRKTAIMTFIEKMSGLAKDVTRYSDKQNVERRQEGKAARGRGDEAPEDAHWAFMEGYEVMSGASDAYNYEKDLAKLLQTDINSDLDTFNKKKDALSNKYLHGRNDAYIEGFISRGMNVEANAEMKYQEAAHKRMQHDFLTKGIKLFKLDYREHSETGASLEENSLAGRELVTELQELAEPYGLSKPEVSKALVKSIGSENAMLGKPENLMFMLEPDVKGGTAMIDDPELTSTISGYINSAIATRSSMAKEAASEKKRIEKEFAVTAGKAIVKALDNNDPALAVKVLEDTGQFMDLDDYKSLTNAIADMRQGSDAFFANTTDQFAFDALRVKAKGGDLTLKQLQADKADLTRSDYRAVFGDIVTKWQEDVARGRAGGKQTSHEITMKRARKNGESLVKQRDKLDAILNPYGAARRTIRYTILFDEIYRKRAAKAGGVEKMTEADDQYVIDKAVYEAFMYEAPDDTETMPPNPDEVTKPKAVDKQKVTDDAVFNALKRLP